jgi:hypothetical protein
MYNAPAMILPPVSSLACSLVSLFSSVAMVAFLFSDVLLAEHIVHRL